MADKVTKVAYAYVTVPDRAGAGAKVLGALRKAGANMHAYLGFPAGGGKAQLDNVPERMAELKRVAKREGWKLSRTKRGLRTVQSPEKVVAFLRSIHGCSPRALGEDFSGTAAVSRAWVRLVEGGRATAVDLDPGVLERAAGVERLEVLCGDARSASDPALHAADVIFVGNFSI